MTDIKLPAAAAADAACSVHDAGAAAIAEAVACGGVSAREIVEVAISRATHDGQHLGAIVHLDADAARAHADSIDRRRAAGEALGPLAGVPITIKDNIAQQGLPLTAGSRMLGGYQSPWDASVVQRLRAADAVPFARTNLDEFGMGSSTETGTGGPCRNPWNPDAVAGGSSGGAAVAVAVGAGALALGTDTGGSVRLPAALCGVVGLKPSYGRVSRDGVVAYASSLEQVGLLGRNIADVSLALQSISGTCERDATSANRPGHKHAAVAANRAMGARIGVPRRFLDTLTGLNPSIRERFDAALQALSTNDCTLVDIELPNLNHSVATYYIIATAEASTNLSRYDGLRYGHRAKAPGNAASLTAASRAEGFGPEVQRRILLGTFVLSSGYQDAYYGRACRVRALLHAEVVAALATCDAIALPTAAATAWGIGSLLDDPLTLYAMDIFTVLANLVGIPAVSLPMPAVSGALGADAMPAGLQLLGQAYDEAGLLSIGAAYEAICGPTPRPPRRSPT